MSEGTLAAILTVAGVSTDPDDAIAFLLAERITPYLRKGWVVTGDVRVAELGGSLMHPQEEWQASITLSKSVTL